MEFVQFVAVNNSEITERKVISQQEIISYKSLGSNTLMTEEKDRESNEKNMKFILISQKKKKKRRKNESINR